MVGQLYFFNFSFWQINMTETLRAQGKNHRVRREGVGEASENLSLAQACHITTSTT